MLGVFVGGGVVIAGLAIAVAVLAGSGAGSSGGSDLADAFAQCAESTSTFDRASLSLEDDGSTLVVSGAELKDLPAVACILGEIDTPQSIIAAMDSTTAMMGRQSEVSDGFSYEWSYHPDNGLDLIVTK